MAVRSEKLLENNDHTSVFRPVVGYVSDGYARGAKIPWRAKMWLKIILSALPFPYGLWKHLGIFKHGDVTSNLTNLKISFQEHVDFYKQCYGQYPEKCLELGPGDSLGHALCAHVQGIKGITFIDVDDFATKEPEHYKAFYAHICPSEKKLPSHEILANFERETILKQSGSKYLTTGLSSFDKISSESIDFSFSHAVLEHIRRDEFADYMHQLYRVHKTGSSARHWVDLHDHMGGALNSFRFSPKFWESNLIRNAGGFYTNRLTMKEMIVLAQNAGFNIEIQKIHKWKTLPTPRNTMHKFFDKKSEEELNVCTFLMILEKV